jgi:hypothetical protein
VGEPATLRLRPTLKMHSKRYGTFLTDQTLMKPSANGVSKSVPTQKSSSSSLRVNTQSEPQTYAHTGRGGMGNYISPSQELPTPSSDVKGDLQSPRGAFDASREKPKDKLTGDKSTTYRGLSGRGGAGNWRQGTEDADKRRMEDEEMEARSRIDESIRVDVEKGLKPPPKVHAAADHAFGRVG